MIVAQSAITARWFTGKELAMAFGITLTIARLGTLFSFNTEELLATRFGWRGALWIAAALCVFSLLCNWIYTLMDRHAEPILHLPEAGSGDKITWSDVGKFRPSYWYAVGICVTFYSAIFPFTALATDFFHDKWGMPMASGRGSGLLRRRLLQPDPHVHHRAGSHVHHHRGVHGARALRRQPGRSRGPPRHASWCWARS